MTGAIKTRRVGAEVEAEGKVAALKGAAQGGYGVLRVLAAKGQGNHVVAGKGVAAALIRGLRLSSCGRWSCRDGKR